jgi:hypothetical protein
MVPLLEQVLLKNINLMVFILLRHLKLALCRSFRHDWQSCLLYEIERVFRELLVVDLAHHAGNAIGLRAKIESTLAVLRVRQVIFVFCVLLIVLVLIVIQSGDVLILFDVFDQMRILAESVDRRVTVVFTLMRAFELGLHHLTPESLRVSSWRLFFKALANKVFLVDGDVLVRFVGMAI